MQKGIPLPANRFTDIGDGSVTDAFTGLMWAKDANLISTRNPSFDQGRTIGDGDVNWETALDYIELLNNQNYLSYSTWRLPYVNELKSLIDHGKDPAGLPDRFLIAYSRVSSPGVVEVKFTNTTNNLIDMESTDHIVTVQK